MLPLALVVLGLPTPGQTADEGKVSTQKPEVAPARTPEGQTQAPSSDRPKLEGGPSATWIWGAEPNTRYFLRKELPAGVKGAILRATCDNRMRVFVNDRVAATSDTWQSPVTVDVSKHLQPGKNLLLVEAANEGGQSGFALKMLLTLADGKTQYLVSDASWQAATSRDADSWVAVKTLGKMGIGPWGDVFSQPTGAATASREVFQVPAGFQVERLYTVPREEQGSWVCITADSKGRLYVSDQGNKGIYRITPAPVGGSEPTRVEKVDIPMSGAQGMLWAFGSLYFSVNGGPGSGFYRARDTNGDDRLDEVVKLKSFQGGGEHGPHSIVLAPDGKSLYVIAGNHTNPPEKFTSSRIPSNWDEDLLLPRQWDANGHARGRLAPGGWIARTDPDGKTWEMVSIGYRNPYDMAFNADGELFAYDADMEWDMGSPWYRPTRVVHATSGSEFGWRSGTGKWPTWYPDSLPEVVDIGPGSPVGVAFGYGAKFPAKYQKALFICDWTFGTMYAIHLEPSGASYRGVKEEFVARGALPLTDVTIASDGALYFTVGGRNTQSELYRVTYVGKEATAPVDARDSVGAELRQLRQQLETLHVRAADQAKAIAFIWPNLGHQDRFIRYAARIALEQQEPAQWQERVLAEKDPQTLITAAVALARQGERTLQPQLVAALEKLDLGSLPESQQLELLRAWSLVFIRMGEPTKEMAAQVASKLSPYYPARSNPLNRELCTVLVYLQAPEVVARTLALMERKTEADPARMAELLARNQGYGGTIARILANQPEIEKIHYALALRTLREGWTLEQRKAYYQWLQGARQRTGGASYQGFINNIDKEAWENTSEAERLVLEASGARKPFQVKELPKPAGPGRDWKLEDLLSLGQTRLKGRSFQNGKKMYAAARCVVCHRFDGDGGATGPDLTQLAGRFNLKDLSEALLEPSKVVSDQYRATIVETSKGKVHQGRVVAETPTVITLLIDPEDSTKVIDIPRAEIEEMKPSPTSLMPQDLLKPLNEDEVLDLLAYLLSRGNPADPMFRR